MEFKLRTALFDRGPLGIAGRLLVILGVLLGTGCGGESDDLAPGCYSGDSVPGAVREAVEAEAAKFFNRIRLGELDAVYAEAASLVRRHRTDQEFLLPVIQSTRSLGMPGELETKRLTVVRFGDGFSHQKEVECRASEGSSPTVLILNDHPVQASLVQQARVGPEFFYYSTLWHREEGAWRLAAFMVKPASLGGDDWQVFAGGAGAQKEKGNDRNAALLYNVAIDLLVANAWSRPPELVDLRMAQRRISVTQLPVNQVDSWAAPRDTFRVFHSAYTMDSGKLALVFRYQSPLAMEDTTAVEEYSRRLRDYVAGTFPEYSEVFPRLVLVATDPEDLKRTWASSFSLGPAP